MKKITLKNDGRLEHLWIPGLHKQIPENAIEVEDTVFLELSQNPLTKKYDEQTESAIDFVALYSFVEAVKSKLTEINSKRDQALKRQDATVEANGSTWQVDPNAMAELNDAITLSTALGAAPEGLEWRDANNVNHPATLPLLLAIASARAVQKDAIWKHSWQLKAQIEALDSETATQADIDNIVVEFN